MNELSLFTGAGGGVLGTKLLNWRTVGYVEWEPYCQKIIEQRIKDGFLDEAPIFGDIDHFIKSGASKKYTGYVDVVTAGFPCQPFSVAGKGRGEKDERNKWPQTLQCIRDVRPRYALLENVPGLLNSGYFGEILSSLAEAGFDARWCVLGADDVGAPHRRKRLWILADSASKGEWEEIGELRPQTESVSHEGRSRLRDGPGSSSPEVADSDSTRQLQPEGSEQNERRRSGDSGEDVADSESERHGRRDREERRDEGRNLQQSEQTGSAVGREAEGRCGSRREDVADSDSPRLSKRWRPESMETEHSPSECGSQGQSTSYWKTEPAVGRVAHGVASRVDRLKALGNGQVPAVAATAWLLLTDQ